MQRDIKQGCCFQEFKKHIIQYRRQKSKSTLQDTIVTLEILLCVGGKKKRAQRRKESTVLVREIRENRRRRQLSRTA